MSTLKTVAVVAPSGPMPKNQFPLQFALYAEDGSPLDLGGLGSTPTGADVELSGYEIGEDEVVAVSESDTVNEAIAKLEARIAILEAAAE